MREFIKRLMLAIPLLLAACAASEPVQQQDSSVQDLAPGDETIIQSPPPATSPESQLEEKPL